MSSPATQTQSLKIKLNFGSPTSRVLARSHSYSNRSLNSSNLNSQPTPPSAASGGGLRNLLDSPIARKPRLSSNNSSEGEVSSTPLSNSVSAEGSTASESNSNALPNVQATAAETKPNRVVRNRLLKVPKRAIPLSISKSPSQNSISGSSQISSSSRGIVKKLYLPKRKFRGTRRSILKASNTGNTDIKLDNIRPPRASQFRTQPVFGIRGYQSFKNKVGKKSRRKGPQPLFKRVLLKNANFATYERMKLIKNIKPREWKLERISNLSDNSANIGVSTWKPTSSRKIRPIILPSAIPISRPPRQQYHTQHQHHYQHQHQHQHQHQVQQPSLSTSSKNIQPHTIPAPMNANKTVTANRGAIPVLSFIDENGNKRLQCPGKDCPKHFADRCGLNRHKKKYHPELEPLGSSSTSQLHT